MTSDVKEAISETPANEDAFQLYLNEIKQFPLLTAEEEKLLAQRCAQQDEEAIRRMATCNLRLVVSVAKEYADSGVPLLDLIQEGAIGLLKAVQKFDYTLDFRFSTYATKWIRQGITRYISDYNLIHIPAYTAERITKLYMARDAYISEYGKEPTAQYLSEQCGIPADKVDRLLRMQLRIYSLDAPVGTEEDGSLSGMVEDLQSPQPYEALVRDELAQTMEALLAKLTQRQQQVLRLRFGMEDGVCHSFEEIGKILNISKERARQVEHEAKDKLQKLGAGMGLEEFLV